MRWNSILFLVPALFAATIILLGCQQQQQQTLSQWDSTKRVLCAQATCDMPAAANVNGIVLGATNLRSEGCEQMLEQILAQRNER